MQRNQVAYDSPHVLINKPKLQRVLSLKVENNSDKSKYGINSFQTVVDWANWANVAFSD